MLLILTFVLILVVCAIIVIFFKNISFRLNLTIIMFGAGFVTVGLVCMVANVQLNEDKHYEKMLQQKVAIEQRIEDMDEDVSVLHKDISEFNDKIKEHKKYCDNIWVNLFYSKKVATIDCIKTKIVLN